MSLFDDRMMDSLNNPVNFLYRDIKVCTHNTTSTIDSNNISTIKGRHQKGAL